MKLRHLVCLLLLAAVSQAANPPAPRAADASVTPASKMDQKWWADRHQQKLDAVKAAAGQVDLLWIGDSKEMMPDLLHPKEKGYGIWAEAVEPMVKKLLAE